VIDAQVDMPVDAVPDGEPDASLPTTSAPASCLAIHTTDPALPSGAYMIDPDGPDGAPPISVTCDMATDGGGWTIVFFAPSEAIDALPIAYTAGNARLMADAQRVLIAYRSATQDAYANFARFDLPADWRAGTPFGATGTDLIIGVSVNGAPLATATVRYGRSNFASLCGDAWDAASLYGRLCVLGTTAPYFSGFTIPNVDMCSDSSQAYSATRCTHDKRFSIAVR
jgi:hypothetical protein